MWQGSEYASYNILGMVTLQVNEYLLRDGCIQNLVKDLIQCFGRITKAFNYFCKILHLKSLRGCCIWVDFKCARSLNIPGLSISQSSEFPGLHRVYIFLQIWQDSEYALGRNYGRTLNIPGFKICQISAFLSLTQGSEYTWIWLNNA